MSTWSYTKGANRSPNNATKLQTNKFVPKDQRSILAGGKLRFGKYKGYALEDIPVSYLRWLVKEKVTEFGDDISRISKLLYK